MVEGIWECKEICIALPQSTTVNHLLSRCWSFVGLLQEHHGRHFAWKCFISLLPETLTYTKEMTDFWSDLSMGYGKKWGEKISTGCQQWQRTCALPYVRHYVKYLTADCSTKERTTVKLDYFNPLKDVIQACGDLYLKARCMVAAGGNEVNICIELLIEPLWISHVVSLLIAATLPNFWILGCLPGGNEGWQLLKGWGPECNNMAGRAGTSLSRPCLTAHEQGVQGGPGDGHHIQPSLQIISQVHRDKTGPKPSWDTSPWVRPIALGWNGAAGPWAGTGGVYDSCHVCLCKATLHYVIIMFRRCRGEQGPMLLDTIWTHRR